MHKPVSTSLDDALSCGRNFQFAGLFWIEVADEGYRMERLAGGAMRCCGVAFHVVLGETGIRLGAFSSNLYLFIERDRQ